MSLLFWFTGGLMLGRWLYSLRGLSPAARRLALLPPIADATPPSAAEIGAGHVCRCTREQGHPMTDYNGRAHGCTCGALCGDA